MNTSTDLVPVDLDARMRYVAALADAGALPPPFRKRPADLLLVAGYADALGLPLAAAISQLYVVEGKVTLSASLVAALVRRAGHRLRTATTYAPDGRPSVTAEVTRSDDPGWSAVAVWDLDRARRAGLADRDTWRKYPEQMLRARATVEAAREACPEVLSGLYLADEVTSGPLPDVVPGIVVRDDVDPLDADDVAADVLAADDALGGVLSPPARAVAEQARTAPRSAMDATRAAMGTPRRTDDRPATDAQLRAIGARLGQVNVRDAEHRHLTITRAVGRAVVLTSSRDLTRHEASTFLDLSRDVVEDAAAQAWHELTTTDVVALDLDDDPADLEQAPDLEQADDDTPGPVDLADLDAIDLDDAHDPGPVPGSDL